MASKNLKKLVCLIEKNSKETDENRPILNPYRYPINWDKAVKYISAKKDRIKFNAEFRPLYATFYKEMMEAGYDKKDAKQLAKTKAKELVKTKFAEQAPA